MKKLLTKILVLAGALVLTLALAAPAFAADTPAQGEDTAQSETEGGSTIGLKAIAAGIAVGIAAAGGAVGTAKSTESIARQPEAEGKVRTTLMLGLVFIETAIIYALLVVILIIFVL